MICEKEKCTGCFACYNICPKNAIEMKEDDNGFVYPVVNKEKCINCNLCKKVCPSLNEVELKSPLKCFAMQAKNNEILKESTSGGAATIFSEYILKNDGIVYGASFEKKFKINHIRIEKIEDLKKLKGSKYVHCYINDTYKKVKEDLLNKKKVLFTGTPCQIAGLKKFLIKDYDNLYCIDIICHGVPSQKYLKDEIASKTELNDITSLKFRIEDDFKIVAKQNDTTVYEKEKSYSKYYEGFMDGFFYRENCYNCRYASSKRCSDITIGDFWGIKDDCILYDERQKGLSVILPITEKGLKLFESCKEEMKFEERNIEEAVLGNSQLRNPTQINKDYFKFKKLYPKIGFEKAYKKCRNLKTFKRRLKRDLKNNKIVYGTYKLIKGSIKK